MGITIPVFERVKTVHALGRSATVISASFKNREERKTLEYIGEISYMYTRRVKKHCK
jgi:hypothetical protein